MEWKEALSIDNQIVICTTSSDGNPHANVVNSKGFIDGKLLVNCCQMNTTLENLKRNNNVCIITVSNGNYFRIRGTVEVFSSGKYFDEAVKRNKPPPVKLALIITIKEVFDLDNVRIINHEL